VRDVKAEQELHALLAGNAHVADLPQLVPRPRVAVEGLIERGIAGDALDRIEKRLIDRAIP
jgi:hypothetical protein